MREDAHTAWAAGLFEGEGTVTLTRRRVRLAVKMTDEETVRRFHKTVGVGTVYGPYPNRSGERDGYPRQDYYLWVAEESDAAVVAEALYQWLGAIRRARIDELLPNVAGRLAA